MRRDPKIAFLFITFILFLNPGSYPVIAGETQNSSDFDVKVRIFPDSHKDQWVDWNVPEADGKEWYKNYFVALAPKLKVGGCFAAHNVSSIHL